MCLIPLELSDAFWYVSSFLNWDSQGYISYYLLVIIFVGKLSGNSPFVQSSLLVGGITRLWEILII